VLAPLLAHLLAAGCPCNPPPLRLRYFTSSAIALLHLFLSRAIWFFFLVFQKKNVLRKLLQPMILLSASLPCLSLMLPRNIVRILDPIQSDLPIG